MIPHPPPSGSLFQPSASRHLRKIWPYENQASLFIFSLCIPHAPLQCVTGLYLSFSCFISEPFRSASPSEQSRHGGGRTTSLFVQHLHSLQMTQSILGKNGSSALLIDLYLKTHLLINICLCPRDWLRWMVPSQEFTDIAKLQKSVSYSMSRTLATMAEGGALFFIVVFLFWLSSITSLYLVSWFLCFCVCLGGVAV